MDCEGFIRLESTEVLGENELAAGEVRLSNDTAHRDDVARAGTDLLAIGQGNVLGQAKVDEVVLRGQRRNLTRNRDLLSVKGKTGLDDTGIKGQRFLGIFGSSRRSSGVRGSSLYRTISTTDIHPRIQATPLTEVSVALAVSVTAVSVTAVSVALAVSVTAVSVTAVSVTAVSVTAVSVDRKSVV